MPLGVEPKADLIKLRARDHTRIGPRSQVLALGSFFPLRFPLRFLSREPCLFRQILLRFGMRQVRCLRAWSVVNPLMRACRLHARSNNIRLFPSSLHNAWICSTVRPGLRMATGPVNKVSVVACQIVTVCYQMVTKWKQTKIVTTSKLLVTNAQKQHGGLPKKRPAAPPFPRV